MAFIEWNNALFSVQNEEIDYDHKKLVKLVNKLHEAMLERKCIEVMEELFYELICYTQTHFQNEEILMDKYSFPYLDHHKAEHNSLIEKVNELYLQHQNGSWRVSIDTFEFLKNWLFHHIHVEDKKLGKYIGLNQHVKQCN